MSHRAGYISDFKEHSRITVCWCSLPSQRSISRRSPLCAPLIAGVACIAIACIEAREFIDLLLEAKLIIGGAATLAVAAALMRLLRGRTTGIVVTPVKEHELVEAMKIGATLPLAAPAHAPAPERGGGEFGGAGASGY